MKQRNWCQSCAIKRNVNSAFNTSSNEKFFTFMISTFLVFFPLMMLQYILKTSTKSRLFITKFNILSRSFLSHTFLFNPILTILVLKFLQQVLNIHLIIILPVLDFTTFFRFLLVEQMLNFEELDVLFDQCERLYLAKNYLNIQHASNQLALMFSLLHE